MCTVAGSLWAARVLPSPDGVCHPGAGTSLLQDVGEAAGCPQHASALEGTGLQGCVGTSGAENQGGVSIPRPQLAPLSLFGTSLLCLEEVPRQSRRSLPLKVSLSQHQCGYPDSLHKETGCLCCWGRANVGGQGAAPTCSWHGQSQGREYRDCSCSVLGSCTPLARL